MVVTCILGLLQCRAHSDESGVVCRGGCEKSINESLRLAKASRVAVAASDADLGLLLALEGLPGPYGGERPWSTDAASALVNAMHHFPNECQPPGSESLREAAISHDGTLALLTSGGKTIEVWKLSDVSRISYFTVDGDYRHAEFSPDGSQVLVVLVDGSARLLDSRTGSRVHDFSSEDRFDQMRFSSDSKRLISVSGAGTTSLWDAASGKKLRDIQADENGSIVSPNAAHVLLWRNSKTLVLQGAETGHIFQTLVHQGAAVDAVFSPDSAHIFTVFKAPLAPSGDARQNIGVLWDTGTGKRLRQIELDDDFTYATFSSDGTRLVTYFGYANPDMDSKAVLWDVMNGKQIREFSWVTREIGFSPDGSKIYSIDDGHVVRLWDPNTGREIMTFPHDREIEHVQVSNDGRQLITVSENSFLESNVTLWDVASGEEVNVLADIPDSSIDTFFSATSAGAVRIARHSGCGVFRLWNARAGVEIAISKQSSSADINRMKFERARAMGVGRFPIAGGFSSKGNVILSTGLDGVISKGPVEQRSVHEQQRNSAPVDNRGGLRSAEFTADGARAMLCGYRFAEVWDVGRNKKLSSVSQGDRDSDMIQFCAFSPTGERIATASTNGTAVLWEAATGKKLQVFRHRGAVTKASFSPDGRMVATTSEDNTVAIWDVGTGAQLHAMPLEYPPGDVHFSPDGEKVVSAAWDRVTVWNARSGQLLRTLESDMFDFRQAMFSPDGSLVLAVAFLRHDGMSSRGMTGGSWITAWHAVTGEMLRNYELGENQVNAVDKIAFVDGGDKIVVSLASMGSNGFETTILFDTDTGERLGTHDHERFLSEILMPDGRLYLLTGGLTDKVWLHRILGRTDIRKIIDNPRSVLPAARACLTPEERSNYGLRELSANEWALRGCPQYAIDE